MLTSETSEEVRSSQMKTISNYALLTWEVEINSECSKLQKKKKIKNKVDNIRNDPLKKKWKKNHLISEKYVTTHQSVGYSGEPYFLR